LKLHGYFENNLSLQNGFLLGKAQSTKLDMSDWQIIDLFAALSDKESLRGNLPRENYFFHV
jgi:hypothetical protein